MINLTFISGSAVRKVIINEKVISLITPEMHFVPLRIDLNKLNETKEQMKENKGLTEEDFKMISDLSALNSEEALKKDIIKDFQARGWRRVLTR